MKNYNSLPERIRRKKEFDENYSASYSDKELNKILTIINGTSDWESECKDIIENDSNAHHFFNVQKAYLRVHLLRCYICEHLLLEEYYDKPDELNEFLEESIRLGIYNDKLSSYEIYDLLGLLLPSYAEYVMSSISDNSIDTVDDLIDAYKTHNKNEFIRLLKSGNLNIHYFIKLCNFVLFNDALTLISIISDTVQFADSNMEIVEKMSITEGTFEGDAILAYRNLQTAAKFDRYFEENLANMQKAYVASVEQLIQLEECFDEKQYAELRVLMQDPLLRPWYDEALTNALTTINAEYEDTNNTTDTDTFSLPDDFFENSAYIDPMVPNRIKGLKSTELKEYGVNHFMQFVKELSNRGLIDRDTESLNKFIRAFTGRTPTTNMKNTQFSKADWKGEFGDLLYTIKYFTYQEKDKYAAVLSLFNFREDVHQKIVQALQRNPASYAKAKKDYSLMLEQLYEFNRSAKR